MEHITNKLLKEVMKFIELCQEGVQKGEIDIDHYFSLTGKKMDLIKELLIEEKYSILFDQEIRERLKNIHEINNRIRSREKYAVGKFT